MDNESGRHPKRVLFSGHAVRRMFERGLNRDDVLGIVRSGEVIADYPDDAPYPSCLLLGLVRGRPVHVVLAHDSDSGTAIVVTTPRFGSTFNSTTQPAFTPPLCMLASSSPIWLSRLQRASSLGSGTT